MSSTTPSGPGCETRNLPQRRLSERFQRLAELQQARRAEDARIATRQRVADAEDVLRRNPFPDSESGANQEIASGGVHTLPSPRRTMKARQGAVEIPAFQEYSTLNDVPGPNGSEHHSFAADGNDQAEQPESSMSFQTAGSSPPSSFQSETTLETVTRDDTETRNSADVDENNGSDIGASMLADPQVQILVDELQRVQEDQRALEGNLDEAKREIDDLRSQLKEAEERVTQAPCDPTTTEAYQNLLSVFRECQGQRHELQIQLDQAEEREKELRRQLRQARQNMEDNEDTIERLNDQLSAARLERDQHAQTAAALQHQLNDSRQQQGVQAENLDYLTDALNRATQDRERYASRVVRLQEQLWGRQHEVARTIRPGRRDTTEDLNDDRVLTRYENPTVTARSALRTRETVETMNGQLCIVRRTTRRDR
ncbi:hypothetical protein K469DRAFT_753764 [Zopfia rhizophila CBS 207.26]|uniref:Uncharacterized protein n=1 Tax=Zopfia rhizophila CBS 207.26 TaxID=1314779 RepID=A0A6A6DNF1_9PEZI|nr:hypothetical protein K469DRAFT_753764 [Zopfia rhizophila CBS 207.26]